MTHRYPACKHIKKPLISDIKITNDVADAIGKNYRTLPMFEKGIDEYTLKKYYSVNNNEYLKCRWTEYKKNIDSRVFAPFQFLDIRDYHFYNCKNRLLPSESIQKKADYRMKLKPGPGVDAYGQVPIPQDLFMKRGVQKPTIKKQVRFEAKNGKDHDEVTKRDSGSKLQDMAAKTQA